MDRLREFLRTQIPHDLAGTDTCSTTHITRGFRECELKAKILDQHRHCGTGHGPRDILNTSFPHEDERGCPTGPGSDCPTTTAPPTTTDGAPEHHAAPKSDDDPTK